MDLEGQFADEEMEEADALVRDLIRRDAWLRRTVQSVAQPQLGHQIVVTVGGPDVLEAHLRICRMSGDESFFEFARQALSCRVERYRALLPR